MDIEEAAEREMETIRRQALLAELAELSEALSAERRDHHKTTDALLRAHRRIAELEDKLALASLPAAQRYARDLVGLEGGEGVRHA